MLTLLIVFGLFAAGWLCRLLLEPSRASRQTQKSYLTVLNRAEATRQMHPMLRPLSSPPSGSMEKKP